MMNSKKHALWFASSALVCLLASAPALAQAPAPAQSADNAVTLGEVVVTATKRSVNLQQVPLSVSVVSQQALQNSTLTDTSDLTRLVPGLQFQTGNIPANSVFFVRGVGTQAAGAGLEQSVGVSYDGVPLASVGSSIADLVDIDRVEALKGPQGMLFGKNASAGLLSIVTKAPQLGKLEATARLYYGSLNNEQFSGTLNVPLGDSAAIRVAAWRNSRDGVVNEVLVGRKFSDRDSKGARFKLRWEPGQNLKVNLTAEWTSKSPNGSASTIREFVPSANGIAPLIQSWEVAHGTVASSTNKNARDVGTTSYYDHGNSAAATAQIDYSVGEGTITSITSFRENKTDTSAAAYPSDNPYSAEPYSDDLLKYSQVSSELRYTSPSASRLRYVAGLFYYHRIMNEIQAVPAGPSSILAHEDLGNVNYAAFTEFTYDVTSALHLIVGGRGSRDQLKTSFVSDNSTSGTYRTTAATHYEDFSWRLGGQYQIKPDVMLYVTDSKGYKGPGPAYNVFSTASSIGTGGGLVKSEIAYNLEGGIKSQWFERRLTLNLAIYDETFDNFQTASVIPGLFPTAITVNAKQMKSTGVDFDANWVVTHKFNLAASVAYNHARYTDFKTAACFNGETQAQGCVNGAQNLSGYGLNNAPTWTTNVVARYETPLTDAVKGFGQATDAFKSEVRFDPRDPHMVQGGVNLVHLSAGISGTDDRWKLSFYVNNLFDKHFVDAIGVQTGGAFYTNVISYDAYRNLGVSLDARF